MYDGLPGCLWTLFCVLVSLAVFSWCVTELGEWLFTNPLDEIHFKLDFIIDQLTD